MKRNWAITDLWDPTSILSFIFLSWHCFICVLESSLIILPSVTGMLLGSCAVRVFWSTQHVLLLQVAHISFFSFISKRGRREYCRMKGIGIWSTFVHIRCLPWWSLSEVLGLLGQQGKVDKRWGSSGTGRMVGRDDLVGCFQSWDSMILFCAEQSAGLSAKFLIFLTISRLLAVLFQFVIQTPVFWLKEKNVSYLRLPQKFFQKLKCFNSDISYTDKYLHLGKSLKTCFFFSCCSQLPTLFAWGQWGGFPYWPKAVCQLNTLEGNLTL